MIAHPKKQNRVVFLTASVRFFKKLLTSSGRKWYNNMPHGKGESSAYEHLNSET